MINEIYGAPLAEQRGRGLIAAVHFTLRGKAFSRPAVGEMAEQHWVG
jgi:hypothetical protein